MIYENDGNGMKPGKRRKGGFLKSAMLAMAIMAACAGLSACGGSDAENSSGAGESAGGGVDYMGMVQTGYLGEYTDATTEEIFDANLGVPGYSIEWTSAEMDGSEQVGFHAYLEGETISDGITVLFQICSDDTFKVSGYAEGDNEDFEMAEIADFLNNWYMNWYLMEKIGLDVSDEEHMEEMRELISTQFDNISGTAVLYGASKDYTGDRGNLCMEIDGTEPMEMTVTELINYYGDNMLDIYAAGSGDENVTEDGMEEAVEENAIEEDAVQGGLVYGTYEAAREDGTTMTATISYDSSSGADTISAAALSPGDRYTGEFDGVLTQIEDSYYEATDEIMETVITVTFTGNGFELGVWDTLYEEMLDLEGTYVLTEALDSGNGGMDAVTEENVVDWFRNANSGDSVRITGKIISVYNIPDIPPAVELSYYVDGRTIYIDCYLPDASDINMYMTGDTVTVTGVYTGKNYGGHGEINADSISLVR